MQSTAAPVKDPAKNPDRVPPPVSKRDFSSYSSSLVVVQGDTGRGSGFIAILGGKPFIFTNAHVLSGNAHPSLRLLSGETLVPGRLAVATNADAAVFQVAPPYKALTLCAQIDSVVKVGDEVMVLGNSAGAEVATELHGVVKGIGPRKIEVDAEFVSGNSGSPVIHVRTGQVIGIATEVLVPVLDAITQDSPFRNLRRFAYRIDVIDKWDTPTLSDFIDEANLLADFNLQTDALLLLAKDIYLNRVPTINVENKRLNKLALPIRDYYQRVAGSNSKNRVLNSNDAQQSLLNRLIFETRGDIALKEAEIKTAYHRAALQEEKEYREFLKEVLSKLLTQ